ncbi:MAG: hypothetical protein OEX11_00745, partial [Nitrosomonas sp.]|nr:hypothetical protein [Nitrosomonas sp.]
YYTGKHPSYPLLFDPQTAGGLLAGIPDEHTNQCLQALEKAGYTATQIGTVNQYDPEAFVTLIDR